MGTQLPPKGTAPNFRPMSVVAKRVDGIFKMPLGTEVGLGPGDIVLDGDPDPSEWGTTTPTFQPMSIVAKRSPISATAELLSCVHTSRTFTDHFSVPGRAIVRPCESFSVSGY